MHVPRIGRVVLASLATFGGGLFAGPARSQGFSTVTAPVQVPLHWRSIDGNTSGPRKLGIYVTLGGGSTPKLFEFDTGGDGFYATYATGTASPWWGNAWTTTGETFQQSFDSGLVYTGTAATTTVQLFGSATATRPLLTAANAIVGQTTEIIDKKLPPADEKVWPQPSGATDRPPVEQAFYGDFGMAPKRGKAGIDQLAAQLLYGPGVTAGFRVHASGENPWVQFGLSAADTAVVATSFQLNATSGTSMLNGTTPAFLTVLASDSNKVKVKDDGKYYLNTGIAPFLGNDVIYNLEGQTLTLVAMVPEMNPGGIGSVLLLVAGGLGLLERRRRPKPTWLADEPNRDATRPAFLHSIPLHGLTRIEDCS